MTEDIGFYRELSVIPGAAFVFSMVFVFFNVAMSNLPMTIMWGVGSIGYLLWFAWCVLKGVDEK